MTTCHLIQADARRIPLPDKSVDLVIGSPPYIEARTYLEDGKNLGIARKCPAWVEWMLDVTTEALRVSRGLVLWVCAGTTKNWTYQPGPEGLLWEWYKRGGECSCFRPVYWYRSSIPGSGHGQWYRADIEYVLAFKRPGKLAYANPTANGHIPKYAPGGEMSHRRRDGERINQWGRRLGETDGRTRNASGEMQDASRPSHAIITVGEGGYTPPALADPGNLLPVKVGGGNMGHNAAHENEAPYPIGVPSFFINSHCPPGGTVLDPFSGSGTTAHAAIELGRNAIGLDLRRSQVKLARRRLSGVTPGFSFSDKEIA